MGIGLSHTAAIAILSGRAIGADFHLFDGAHKSIATIRIGFALSIPITRVVHTFTLFGAQGVWIAIGIIGIACDGWAVQELTHLAVCTI